ncbi:MAG TPA: hypothetical protein PK385_09455 [Spirochaetota bacterium]|nr:hypothetical protein [Spirochaetota bacterium]HOS33214.1 hypothetical protein [Spirochaetota bacterium]HOS56271.1 hypothetical protein [Spirochaetota bacterium]HPK61695.1 hypothetical protein [Spirochaetota bacterium]HQF77485.1 hypothetical protein [Spirochaetota bacterium]
MRKIVSLILIIAAIALIGCQLPKTATEGDGATTTTSTTPTSTTTTTTLPKKACIMFTENESACAYYSGENYSSLEVKTYCLNYDGALSTACPTANIYGKCTVTKDDPGDNYYMVIYNDSSEQAKAEAETDCNAIQGGVWTLGSN